VAEEPSSVTSSFYMLSPDDDIFCGRLEQQALNRPLYVRGSSIKPLEKTVGIVGTRHASSYGLKVAYELGKYYASEGYVVISGLAYGIDQKSHEGALEKGTTVGVLGHGLDFHYPKSTLPLRKSIEEKGFVITWYNHEQGPRKAFFRERNWLIAALSDFIVVVEAPMKSGALITANFALQMGKEVKAVPGDIDRDSSAGSNMLIFEGAEPVLAIPKDAEEQYKSCKTVQDLVAAVGSLVEAGQLIAKWQSTGRVILEGEIIHWV